MFTIRRTLALMTVAALSLGAGLSQANAFEPINHKDVNGYSNGKKYDDMYDDKYTEIDKYQNKIRNGWNAGQDPDVGYHNGVKYDDVKDDGYGEVDRIQDKTSRVNKTQANEAYYFPQQAASYHLSSNVEIDYE